MWELQSSNYKDVMRFARKIGVSSGIVVGQMQHKNIIQKNRYNFLKTRYSWQ
jgi:HTH-type transcriptional regulator / antitoxin HigA